MNGKPGSLLFHGFALTIGTVVQALAGLATQIILMRILAPEDFGGFVLVLAGCSLVQTILSLRLNILIIRLPEDDLHTARLYQTALVWETLVSAIVASIWLILADLMSGPAFILLCALTLGQWVNQAISFYERRMDYGRISLVETSSQLAGHALALAFAFSGIGALSLYVRELAIILFRLFGFLTLHALPVLRWEWPSRSLFVVLKQARSAWSEGVLEGIFARLVILISGNLTGLHGAGIFAQSQRLALVPHQFLAPVITRMTVNLFSRTQDPRFRASLLLRIGCGVIAILLPTIAAIWLLSEDFIPWLLGEKWREAGLALQAMIGVTLFLSLFDLMRSFCYSIKQVGAVLAARMTQIVVFTLPVFWWSSIDVQSLAWLLSLSYACGFAVILAIAWKKLTRPASD